MDLERWQQIERLYHLALEMKPGERTVFLDHACADDPSLRQEIESLLAVADDTDGYIKAAIAEAQPDTLQAGSASRANLLTEITRKLRRYELLAQVGKGG